MHGAGWQWPRDSAGTVYMCQSTGRGRRPRLKAAGPPRCPWCSVVGSGSHRHDDHPGRNRDPRAVPASANCTIVCAALYLTGCVAAVLVVRRSALFTAVVQPPLILFIAVPTAYYLFHRAEIAGVKDVLINCGYPLIQRFPLMLITSLLVLLIGLARWYLSSTDHLGEAIPGAAGPSLWIARQVNTLLGRSTNTDGDESFRPSRTHAARRQAAPPRSAGEGRPRRTTASRSRHTRPPMDDPVGPVPTPRGRYIDYARDHGERTGPPPPSRRRRERRDPGRRATQRQRDVGADGPACPAPATEPIRGFLRPLRIGIIRPAVTTEHAPPVVQCPLSRRRERRPEQEVPPLAEMLRTRRAITSF